MNTPIHSTESGAEFAAASAGERLALIADSYLRLTGNSLVEDGANITAALWFAPRAIVAHGTQDDPVFFYANRLALQLFECTIADFTRMPSRLSAEPLHRDERARLLAQVTEHGFIDNYAGIRISARGNRFRIEQAVVWNLVDAAGTRHGQAATFDRWVPL